MKRDVLKKIIAFSLVSIMLFEGATPYFAAVNSVDVPVVDDTFDYSEVGAAVCDYEDKFIIQSYDITEEEKELGEALQGLHIHESKSRHASIYPHIHSIANIKTGTAKSYTWYPSTIWVQNSLYQNESSYPTVSWTSSQSKTESASVSTSVGVTDSVVSSSLGSSYTKSHSISTSTTITYKVPYKKTGRIRVTYNRPYKTFTCVTTYYSTDLSVSWQETGAGSAYGAPYNITASLQTKNVN